MNTGDLCSASSFYVVTAMTFSFLKFRFILLKRIVNKQKKYSRIILGSIFPKNKMNYYNIGKRNTEPSVLRKIESNHTNVVTQFFLFRHFSPSKEQSIDFYSNQGLYFQYQKENDQECTVRNPALKSLGR